MYKNGLNRKIRLVLKFIMSQPGQQTITMHILTNISGSNKGNQTMTFGQLIEYNLRNIFVEKSYTNVLQKLFPDPYLKYQN